MKRNIFFLLASLVVVLSLAACAAPAVTPVPNQNKPYPQLTASGSGIVYVVPDIAYVSIGVQNQSSNVSTALKDNNLQAQAVAKTLTDMGIDAKDIQTSSFNISPQQKYGDKGEVIGTDYVVTNTVYVTVRDLQKLPDLLDKVVSAGANTINGINFDVVDKVKATEEARNTAIANAKKNAQQIAEAAGVTLGEVLNINAYSTGGPVPIFEGKGGAMASAANVPIAAGQMTITVNADMTYAIK